MRIIALIDQAEVIERILRHLKLWMRTPVTRSNFRAVLSRSPAYDENLMSNG